MGAEQDATASTEAAADGEAPGLKRKKTATIDESQNEFKVADSPEVTEEEEEEGGEGDEEEEEDEEELERNPNMATRGKKAPTEKSKRKLDKRTKEGGAKKKGKRSKIANMYHQWLRAVSHYTFSKSA